uniref:Pro-neuregulin 2-like protein n=1 Tax=Saccoglossus kowalevskii TaxID=10224 RepID=A0A1C9TA62_SACKO|nr:pro-neuregulin 2-like protein [Saccoglossus kowalevskii]
MYVRLLSATHGLVQLYFGSFSPRTWTHAHRKMERNLSVIILCSLIALCLACTPETELNTDHKAYKATTVIEGIIERINNNSVIVETKKVIKPDQTLQEKIIILGFGTQQPCIINADELLIGEKYFFFIRLDEGSAETGDSYVVDSNPVTSGKDELRAIRKIVCEGCAQPPTIKKRLRNKTVIDGNKFTLKCGIAGFPQPEISWTKDGEVLTQGVRTKKSSSRVKVKKALQSKHAGNYTCIGNNWVDPPVSTSAIISVCSLECVHGEPNLKKCRCKCEDNWKGEKCDIERNSCHSKKCKHGSLNKESCKCICDDGYSGEFCNVTSIATTTVLAVTVPQCPKVTCGAHGALDVPKCECNCEYGWQGDLCETATPQHGIPCEVENFCLNQGKCYYLPDIGEKICHCPAPHTGPRCQYKDPFHVERTREDAEQLQAKRVLTVVGIFVALLVLIIICIIAWCKARTGKKKYQKRQKEKEKEKRKKEKEKEKLMTYPVNRINGDVPLNEDCYTPMQSMKNDPDDVQDELEQEEETSFVCPLSHNSGISSAYKASPDGCYGDGSPHHSLGSRHSNNSPYSSYRGSPQRVHQSSPRHNFRNHSYSPTHSPLQDVPLTIESINPSYANPDHNNMYNQSGGENDVNAPLHNGMNLAIHETDSDLEDEMPRMPVAETEEEDQDSNLDDSYIYLCQQPDEPVPEHAFIRPMLDSFEVGSNDFSLAEAEDGSVYTNDGDVTTNASESDSDSSSSASDSSSSSDDNTIPNLLLETLQQPYMPSDKESGEYAWDDEGLTVLQHPEANQPRHCFANPHAVTNPSPEHRQRQQPQRTAPIANHYASNPLYARPQQSPNQHRNQEMVTDEEYLSRLKDMMENQKTLKI